jgi:hypothetical protein
MYEEQLISYRYVKLIQYFAVLLISLLRKLSVLCNKCDLITQNMEV